MFVRRLRHLENHLQLVSLKSLTGSSLLEHQAVMSTATDSKSVSETNGTTPTTTTTTTTTPPATTRPPVYIVSAVRTPLGAFQGALSHLSATQLGGIAIKAALERAGLPPSAVEEVLMGNVCSANLGQAPARQAALYADLPMSTICTTVNKVCSSGMKAIMLAAQSIQLGQQDIIVAGGMESMSNIPYYSPDTRSGARLGHVSLIDGMIKDGLWDPVYNIHMGECAEMCADKYAITREEQDAHAIESVARAKQAQQDGIVDWEIVPVEGKKARRDATPPMVTQDESVAKMDPEKLKKLQPHFRKPNGTVTAGNASPITDGGAAVVLASEAAVAKYNLPVIAKIIGYADAEQDPKDFPTTPSLAAPKAIKSAGIKVEDVDYWEINEAFSVVDLANRKLLCIDPAKINVLGGSVAVGHPLGASGCRLVVTMLNVLRTKGGKIGVAAICNGGGGASAIVLEKV